MTIHRIKGSGSEEKVHTWELQQDGNNIRLLLDGHVLLQAMYDEITIWDDGDLSEVGLDLNVES